MKPGPPPQPGSVRSLKRAAQADDAPPRIPTAPPPAPDYLTETAAGVWVETVDRLRELNLLESADLNLVSAYSEAVARHRLASQELESASIVGVSDRGGQSVHPAARVQQQAAEAMRKLSIEIGLTLSGRMKLGKPEGKQGSTSLEVFMDARRRWEWFERFPDLKEHQDWVMNLPCSEFDSWAAAQERKYSNDRAPGPRPV